MIVKLKKEKRKKLVILVSFNYIKVHNMKWGHFTTNLNLRRSPKAARGACTLLKCYTEKLKLRNIKRRRANSLTPFFLTLFSTVACLLLSSLQALLSRLRRRSFQDYQYLMERKNRAKDLIKIGEKKKFKKIPFRLTTPHRYLRFLRCPCCVK